MVSGELARCHVTVANEKPNWVKERYEQIKILVNKNKLCFDWGIPRVGKGRGHIQMIIQSTIDHLSIRQSLPNLAL